MLFDFYGTLARAVAWGPTVSDVLGRWGAALDPVAEARWNDETADGIDHAEHSVDRDAYRAWAHARFRRLATGCGVGAADLDEVVVDLYRASRDYVLEAYDDVPQTLAELRRRGITVAVCSNWDWDLDTALAATGLHDLVDVCVTSARAGARKPHPRIYEVTLRRCGVDAQEALFVGDTWGPDVEGPRAVGIASFHLQRDAADLRAVLDLVGV